MQNLIYKIYSNKHRWITILAWAVLIVRCFFHIQMLQSKSNSGKRFWVKRAQSLILKKKWRNSYLTVNRINCSVCSYFKKQWHELLFSKSRVSSVCQNVLRDTSKFVDMWLSRNQFHIPHLIRQNWEQNSVKERGFSFSEELGYISSAKHSPLALSLFQPNKSF